MNVKIMRSLIAAARIAVIIVAAYGASHLVASDQPECPTEDSCAIDYRDGRWHITEEAP